MLKYRYLVGAFLASILVVIGWIAWSNQRPSEMDVTDSVVRDLTVTEFRQVAAVRRGDNIVAYYVGPMVANLRSRIALPDSEMWPSATPIDPLWDHLGELRSSRGGFRCYLDIAQRKEGVPPATVSGLEPKEEAGLADGTMSLVEVSAFCRS